jgi:hypothetical protein
MIQSKSSAGSIKAPRFPAPRRWPAPLQRMNCGEREELLPLEVTLATSSLVLSYNLNAKLPLGFCALLDPALYARIVTVKLGVDSPAMDHEKNNKRSGATSRTQSAKLLACLGCRPRKIKVYSTKICRIICRQLMTKVRARQWHLPEMSVIENILQTARSR